MDLFCTGCGIELGGPDDGRFRCVTCLRRRARRVGMIVAGVLGLTVGVVNFFVPGLVAFVSGAVALVAVNLITSYVAATFLYAAQEPHEHGGLNLTVSRLERSDEPRRRGPAVYISLDLRILFVSFLAALPVCWTAFLPEAQWVLQSVWFQTVVAAVTTALATGLGSTIDRLG